MRPTPQTVRDAAEALKQAIDAHLFAVETRLGDSDVAVELAYRDIRIATERYDRLLLEAYNEVTPFMFMDAQQQQEPVGHHDLLLAHSSQLPEVVSVCVRRDYAVLDSEQLLDNGRQAHEAARHAGLPLYEQDPPDSVASALYAMFQVGGLDGLDTAAGQAGLSTLGGALWFMTGEEPQAVDIDTAFDHLDPQRVIFRVHEVPEEINQAQDQLNGEELVGDPGDLGEGPDWGEHGAIDEDEAVRASATRTPWSFETDQITRVDVQGLPVGQRAEADPESDWARAHMSPSRSAQDSSAQDSTMRDDSDPLDTTDVLAWQEETNWPMSAVDAEPGYFPHDVPSSSARDWQEQGVSSYGQASYEDSAYYRDNPHPEEGAPERGSQRGRHGQESDRWHRQQHLGADDPAGYNHDQGYPHELVPPPYEGIYTDHHSSTSGAPGPYPAYPPRVETAEGWNPEQPYPQDPPSEHYTQPPQGHNYRRRKSDQSDYQ